MGSKSSYRRQILSRLQCYDCEPIFKHLDGE